MRSIVGRADILIVEFAFQCNGLHNTSIYLDSYAPSTSVAVHSFTVFTWSAMIGQIRFVAASLCAVEKPAVASVL
jgi:hypothetical protein